MSEILPFDRLERKVLKTDADGVTRIDAQKLAHEVSRYDKDVQERLRRAALRAIEEELALIRTERQVTMSEKGKSIGVGSACACGGEKLWTGRERRRQQIVTSIAGATETLVEAEYKCSGCGRTDWSPIGTEK